MMQWKEDSKHKYWANYLYSHTCAIVCNSHFSKVNFLRGFLAQSRNPEFSFLLSVLYHFVVYWVAGYVQEDTIPEQCIAKWPLHSCYTFNYSVPLLLYQTHTLFFFLLRIIFPFLNLACLLSQHHLFTRSDLLSETDFPLCFS